MDFYQIIGFAAGTLIVVNTLPQLMKILKTKEVEDISIGMFGIVFLAQILWLIYGFHIKDIPVIFTNGAGMVLVTTNIDLIFKYRKVPARN